MVLSRTSIFFWKLFFFLFFFYLDKKIVCTLRSYFASLVRPFTSPFNFGNCPCKKAFKISKNLFDWYFQRFQFLNLIILIELFTQQKWRNIIVFENSYFWICLRWQKNTSFDKCAYPGISGDILSKNGNSWISEIFKCCSGFGSDQFNT